MYSNGSFFHLDYSVGSTLDLCKIYHADIKKLPKGKIATELLSIVGNKKSYFARIPIFQNEYKQENSCLFFYTPFGAGYRSNTIPPSLSFFLMALVK